MAVLDLDSPALIGEAILVVHLARILQLWVLVLVLGSGEHVRWQVVGLLAEGRAAETESLRVALVLGSHAHLSRVLQRSVLSLLHRMLHLHLAQHSPLLQCSIFDLLLS